MPSFREPPRPNYEYDVRKLVGTYEKALKDVQAELDSLFLTDFERKQIRAVEANIREILKDLRKYSNDWTKQTISKAAKEGVATSIYALGIAATYEEALKIAKLGSVNRSYVDALIADTQSDLLAVTQNVERRTRAAIRKATADVMREKASAQITGTQSIQQSIVKEIRKKLGNAADSAIIDAAGRRWKLRTYANMLARTKTMEAHTEATRNDATERGVSYAVISRHGATDACRDWEGKIIKISRDAEGNFTYIDDLPRDDIFHPNCGHLISPIQRPDRLPQDLRELNGI